MFVDKAVIKIKAGDGGNGAVAFLRLKGVPYGGPDGGNGGNGGNVVFEASSSKSTLSDFYYKKTYLAPNGENGRDKNCYGKNGADMVIQVPTGTIIRDFESGEIVCDMFHDGQREVVLTGGIGGKGNASFANSRRKAPRFSQHGEKREVVKVVLELKTIADVGFVGFPNAGKSTLLSVISNARPKIANYPFTTLSPNLGVVEHREYSFVAADIPGLIEGASQGIGLGLNFLKHIERTRLIVHVVDMSQEDGGSTPLENFKIINNELKQYSKDLVKLPQIIAANKMDGDNAQEHFDEFIKKLPKKYKAIPIIAIINEGVDKLLDAICQTLQTLPIPKPMDFTPFDLDVRKDNSFEVNQLEEGVFEVTGGLVDMLTRNVVISDRDSFRYFQTQLKERGVIKQLKGLGIKDRDTVIVGEAEFEYLE